MENNDALANYLKVAIEAAKQAGSIQLEHFRKEIAIRSKTIVSDLVTEVDMACEAAIREIILSNFPDHEILGEEEGLKGKSNRLKHGSSHRWLVDPLDGTINYAHGFPIFCTSIALDINGETQIGVVFDAVHDELFTAVLGNGAKLNGDPINVSKASKLDGKVLLATGFPYDIERAVQSIDIFKQFITRGLPVRRPGSAAIDLCYVACGRIDGFWEQKLRPWDCAAGNLLIKEAGGKVTNFAGTEYKHYQEQIIASNGLIHHKMIEIISNGSLNIRSN